MQGYRIKSMYSEKILHEQFRDEKTPNLSCFVCEEKNPIYFFRAD